MPHDVGGNSGAFDLWVTDLRFAIGLEVVDFFFPVGFFATDSFLVVDFAAVFLAGAAFLTGFFAIGFAVAFLRFAVFGAFFVTVFFAVVFFFAACFFRVDLAGEDCFFVFFLVTDLVATFDFVTGVFKLFVLGLTLGVDFFFELEAVFKVFARWFFTTAFEGVAVFFFDVFVFAAAMIDPC